MSDEKSALEPLQKTISGNWHDRFFKANFGTPEQVWALLELALTPAQLATLDRTSLVIRSGSMIDEESLKEYVSDLLVEVSLTDGSEFVLTLICEHKSYNDQRLMSQLLTYIARLYERKAKVVVPIVIYHGRTPWAQRLSFYETQHADLSPLMHSAWGELLVNFGLILLNLRQAEVLSELRRRSLPVHLGMQVLGEIWEANERYYFAWLERTLGFDLGERRRFLRQLSVYLMATKPEVKMAHMRELSEVSRPDDATMREALDFWEKIQPSSAAEFFDAVRKEASKEAREKGLEEGLEKGLEEGHKQACLKIAERLLGQGIAISEVQVATQLSLEEIDSLKNGGARWFDS